MKKLLIALIALTLTYIPVHADDDLTLTFNNASIFHSTTNVSETSDLYIFLLSDVLDSSDEDLGRFLSGTIYIPKSLLVEGTHDLAVLEPKKNLIPLLPVMMIT